jgi:hypothetical protein
MDCQASKTVERDWQIVWEGVEFIRLRDHVEKKENWGTKD